MLGGWAIAQRVVCRPARATAAAAASVAAPPHQHRSRRHRRRAPPPPPSPNLDTPDPTAPPLPTMTARWPRPLAGSLADARSVVAARAPPADVAASASRFPYVDRFHLVDPHHDRRNGGGGSGDGGGVEGAEDAPSPLPLATAAQIAAMLTPFIADDRAAKFAAVAAARRFDVLPIIEGVHDRGNLGAICRTCDALGIGAILASDVETATYRPTRGRCSSGAEKWIDVMVHKSVADAVAAAKAAGYRVAVAAAGPAAIAAGDVDWEATPTAFIVGNEHAGVSAAARAAADIEVQVPMAGMVESLNVSVATALIASTALARIDAAVAAGAARSRRLGDAEAAVMAAVLLARHKAQHGKSGWRAPLLRELVARGYAGEGGREV